MRQQQRGFTLIELMISLVMFSFAIAGVLAVAVSMSQGFREQRAAVGAEGAARVPMDFLQDALRQVSPGAPTFNIQDVNVCVAGVAVTGAVTVTNGLGINGSDQLNVIYASGAVVTSLRTAYNGSATTTVTVNDGSQIVAGDYVVISNLSQGHLVLVTASAANVLSIAAPCGAISLPAGGYPPGSLVIRAQHAVFYLALVDTIPTLMMNASGDPTTNALEPAGNGEPLAEGIEDFQVALGVDTTNNGVTEVGAAPNDDEWLGNVAGDSGMNGSNVWVYGGTLRALRITLVARTTSNYVGAATSFLRPAAEDNPAATVADSYRRRVLQTTVELRNITGASP